MAFGRMAGAVGFEPTVHDTKNRCLTTWLRPNCEKQHNDLASGLQDCFLTKCNLLQNLVNAGGGIIVNDQLKLVFVISRQMEKLIKITIPQRVWH